MVKKVKNEMKWNNHHRSKAYVCCGYGYDTDWSVRSRVHVCVCVNFLIFAYKSLWQFDVLAFIDFAYYSAHIAFKGLSIFVYVVFGVSDQQRCESFLC